MARLKLFRKFHQNNIMVGEQKKAKKRKLISLWYLSTKHFKFYFLDFFSFKKPGWICLNFSHVFVGYCTTWRELISGFADWSSWIRWPRKIWLLNWLSEIGILEIQFTTASNKPGWNCLNVWHVFVGYQPNFPWFYEIPKETSTQQNFTDSI